MDLGAAICLPKNPRCLVCPLMADCMARRSGTQELRPVLKPKKETPHVVHAAAVIVRRGRVLLARRPSTGLLGGMWEFPNAQVQGDPPRRLSRALKSAYGISVRHGPLLAVIEHAYTHFSVSVHAFQCELIGMDRDSRLKWIRLGELSDYPMGRIDRQIARKIASS